MIMEFNRYQNSFVALLAALSAWFVLAAGLITWLDSQAWLLGSALFVFTAVASFLRLFRFVEVITVLLSAVLYGYVQFALRGASSETFANLAIFLVGMIGIAALTSIIRRVTSDAAARYTTNQNLVEALKLYDDTGLLKWHYARQRIRQELERGRRWDMPVSVMLLQVANWDEVQAANGAEEAEALLVELSDTIKSSFRVVDEASRFDETTFGLLLPQTNSEMAAIAARRVLDVVAQKARIGLYAGIATFPHDGVTDEALINVVETALQFARTSDTEIVLYNKLTPQTEPQKVTS